jgi:hypothetical protein
LYTFGKWASNFSVLLAMNLVLAIAGIGIQFLAGESMQLNIPAMFAPFLFITLPMMALVAAVAVLFESIGFLSGGFGNVLYFFMFVFIFPLADNLSKTNPAVEPLGMGLIMQSAGAAASVAFPEYDGGFVLGDPSVGDTFGLDIDPASFIFHWTGVDWTPDIILKRFAFFGIAIVITLLASLFFDRFDPSRRKPRNVRTKRNASPPMPEVVTTKQKLSQPPSGVIARNCKWATWSGRSADRSDWNTASRLALLARSLAAAARSAVGTCTRSICRPTRR